MAAFVFTRNGNIMVINDGRINGTRLCCYPGKFSGVSYILGEI